MQCPKCNHNIDSSQIVCNNCNSILPIPEISDQQSAREALQSGRYDNKFSKWSRSKLDDDGWICENCGTVGFFETSDKGNMAIGCCFYAVAILPGLIYSAWRASTRQKRCDKCGSSDVIKIATPRGRELVNRYHPSGII